jgi:hypothetical protein
VSEKSISYCGLSCATCAISQAHTRSDENLRKLALAIYRKTLANSSVKTLELDDIKCEGCRSEFRFTFCQACEIRECCREKGYDYCFECDVFPCQKIDEFPVSRARTGMLEAGANCKEMGPETWQKKIKDQFTCKECGTLMFRGASRCRNCKASLDIT